MYKIISLKEKEIYTSQFESLEDAVKYYQKLVLLVKKGKRLSVMLFFIPAHSKSVILLNQCNVSIYSI